MAFCASPTTPNHARSVDLEDQPKINFEQLKQFYQKRKMELENMERERLRLYKQQYTQHRQQLKEQMQKQARARKDESSYKRKKQLVDKNGLIDHLNQNDIRRLSQRKHTHLMLNEQNTEMSTLKKNGSHGEDGFPGVRKGNSFNDQMVNQDVMRLTKLKQDLIHQSDINHLQDQIRRKHEGQFKSAEREGEYKHTQRVNQMQLESKRNYEEILRKHAQNMKLYDQHSQFMHEHELQKKHNEKFTDCNDDILSHLHRDQATQRMRNYLHTQEVLKNQMDEYKEKRSQEKSHILEGHELEKSIFRSLLHDDQYNKKTYANELKGQMSQFELRRNEEMKNYREAHISGVFGGEHDRERKYQLKYMDRKAGASRPVSRKNRSHFIENSEEDDQKINQIKYLKNPATNQLPQINGQNDHHRPRSKLHQSMSIQKVTRNQKLIDDKIPNTDYPKNNQMNAELEGLFKGTKSPGQTPRQISKDQQVLKPPVQNSYQSSYEPHPQSQYQRNPIQPPSVKIPIYLNQQPQKVETPRKYNEERKLFRSYDLVTGKSRYYG